MTLALAICVFMVITGAAFLGWLLRWNIEDGGEPLDPRESGRADASEAAR